jgi:hypothetical protein
MCYTSTLEGGTRWLLAEVESVATPQSQPVQFLEENLTR